MSFTLTDTELTQLIQNASLAAAEQAARNAVAELIAKQTGKPVVPENTKVQQATEEEARKILAQTARMRDEEAAKIKAADADFDAVVEEFGYKATTGTYDADDAILAEEVKTELDKLKEGQISGLITTDNTYSVVRLDKETDEEATEKNRESIIATRKEEKHSEVLKEMQKDDGWKAKDSLLSKISFKNHLTTIDPNAKNTESVDTTEAK